MATIYPIRCFRPARHFANKFVRKPSDFTSMDKEEVMERLLTNSVFSISQPELFGYTFEEGKEKFARFLREGFIYPEVRPAFYVYEIKNEERSRLGLVCNQNISDLDTGKLLLHEKTKAKNSQFLETRLSNLKLNFTPIFSIAPDQNQLLKGVLSKSIENQKPDISISLPKEQHLVYKISLIETADEIRKIVQGVHHIYLADGHHRLSVLKKQGREQFSTVVFPESDVSLFSYAKIIREMPIHLVQNFQIELKKKLNENQGQETGKLSVFDGEQWTDYSVACSQVELLKTMNAFITSHFSIQNLNDDDRVLYLKDLYGKDSLAKFTNNMNAQLAVQFEPLSLIELFQTANANENLPAKSTLFHPKPRAGLFITRI